MTENKGDLISRSALKAELEAYRHTRNYKSDEDEAQHNLLDNILEDIDNAPTVEPERPQGEWKLHGMIYYCTNCGKDYEQGGNNYCGNCGAKMKGANNG